MSVLALMALCGVLNSASTEMGWHGSRAATSVPTVQAMASKSITVEGRAVTVRVELWRDLMPGFGGSSGKMMSALSFSTTDARMLPGITDVKVRFEKSGGAVWTPRLQPVPTFAYDPMSAMYSASGGPKWSLNSKVTAKIEFKAAGRTHRVDIPVRVAGVY